MLQIAAVVYGYGTGMTMTNICKRPWAAIPDSLDVVINLQQVLVCPHGADTNEIDALIKVGFVISNVTVLDVTPLYLTFYVRLWRYETTEEKKLYPTGSITARSAMPRHIQAAGAGDHTI